MAFAFYRCITRKRGQMSMKSIQTKFFIPIATALVGIVFLFLGVTELGFWDSVNGPGPGFFPSLVSVVIILTSILAFFQSLKDGETGAPYKKEELLVVAAGACIIAGSFIIGLLPSCFAFVLLWLKVHEKAPWKATLIVTAIVAFIAVGVFAVWLGVAFPMGIFENF